MNRTDRSHIYLGIVIVIISALTCVQTSICIAQNAHSTLTAMTSATMTE